MKKQKVYLIGIWWIGVSALARHYLWEWWEVYGSDATHSKLIDDLIDEGCDVIIWSDSTRISTDIKKVIFSEAIPKTQEELQLAQESGIETLKYNKALAEIANPKKLIAISGTHGKSTTTSMVSQIFQNSREDFTSVVGTILKEFDEKNYFSRWKDNYFIIEACEYKNHFLEYKPSLAVITNIEYDHADYFKTPESYVKAFENFINNILPGGFCIINSDDTNCSTLIWLRNDIHYILVGKDNFSTIFPGETSKSNIEDYPEIVLQIPGEHILFDAKLAYVVWYMAGIPEVSILESLEEYSWVWRRMEKIGNTENGNILMSDYAHHPTEISTTLKALKSWYPNTEIFTIFQPHQYSRTIELLEGFKTCFSDTDILIIPDIYESRDSDEDKSVMNSKIFVESIEHPNIIDGNGLENSLPLIEKYDSENPDSSIILLLWAWNIDNLRYKIKTS